MEFIWEQETSESPEQENILMSKLSLNLRDEIFLHTNVKFLKSMKTFRVFNEKTLISLSSHMKKLRFSPEEYVYKVFDIYINDAKKITIFKKRRKFK